jgi:hypothetical protein
VVLLENIDFKMPPHLLLPCPRALNLGRACLIRFSRERVY